MILAVTGAIIVMRMLARALAATSLLGWSVCAWSGEVIEYSYDAKGRLVAVIRAGGVNDGVSATYQYDNADNRTQVVVAGSGGAPPAVFSVGDASIAEGGTLTFTLTRTGDTGTAQAVSYTTVDGTATSPADYSATSGTSNFAAGETSRAVTVATVQDTLVEGNETLSLTLSSPTNGATLADATGIGTITDDDQPISYAVNDVTVTEGGALVFTVTRTGTSSTSQSISFATADGSAVAGSDYTAASGSLTFAPTDTSKTISVTTIDDTIVEAAETLFVNLSGAPARATINDSQGVGNITDQDGAARPSIYNKHARGY